MPQWYAHSFHVPSHRYKSATHEGSFSFLKSNLLFTDVLVMIRVSLIITRTSINNKFDTVVNVQTDRQYLLILPNCVIGWQLIGDHLKIANWSTVVKRPCTMPLTPVCGLWWFPWDFIIGLPPLQATVPSISVSRGSVFSRQHLHGRNAYGCQNYLRVYTLKKMENCHTWEILISETIYW